MLKVILDAVKAVVGKLVGLVAVTLVGDTEPSAVSLAPPAPMTEARHRRL